MATERFSADERSESSKKLQTTFFPGEAPEDGFWLTPEAEESGISLDEASMHDTRIAHEQREELQAAKAVILNLVAAMNYAVSEGCVDHLDCAMDKGASWYAAQAAAAPFLSED